MEKDDWTKEIVYCRVQSIEGIKKDGGAETDESIEGSKQRRKK